MAPTTIIKTNKIFTDFKYFFISGLFSFFEKNPAPSEITIKKRNTNTSITIKIPNFPSIMRRLYSLNKGFIKTFCL